MATLAQAIEHARSGGRPPGPGPVSVRDLHRHYEPLPKGSLRALQLRMFRGANLPWAIILCRFKGEAPDPAREGPIERFYRSAFTPGSGGLVEYWRDVSLGRVEISGSRVFGWLEVDLPREKADTESNPGQSVRSILVDAAIAAAQRNGIDPITGFHSQLSVYTQNWSVNGVPAGLDWSDPTWGKYWIDGSADGRGKVNLTPPHNANIVAHEMGHGFGLRHDLAADFVADYGDPCCIMSQHNAFVKQPFNVAFGPALCLPHLVLKGWMYPGRLYVNPGQWIGVPDGIKVELAAINDPGARAFLGAKLMFSWAGARWDYYLEHVRPTEWDRGLGKSYVIVRRVYPHDGPDPTAAFLGAIEVPAASGAVTRWREPRGGTIFTVERRDPEGRIVQVGAIR